MSILRLWHYELLKYLPDKQFKGQWRELIAIMHDWRDKGKTNHILINRVMNYSKNDLFNFYIKYATEYKNRYNSDKVSLKFEEFANFAGDTSIHSQIFEQWHNDDYLKICMSNLYEKHYIGIGSSRITDKEWQTLEEGYKIITGNNYIL